jgi:amidohydrolase
MAAASDFVISITGKGGHGAVPQLARDPIVAGAQIVSALQTIVSRHADPLDHAVVSVCQFHSGSANNVIPEVATLTGTFRTFRREVRDLVEARMNEIVGGVARSLGCQADIQIVHHTEPVSNDAQAAARSRAVFQRLGCDQFVYERTMGAEDVGYLMTDIPGMYFFLGSANSERDLDHPHHHPRFDFDEEALPLGVALLSAAVADYLLVE